MPLAYDIRPRDLRHFVGQDHLIDKNSWLKNAITNDDLSSMIFFGPPGTGKTTLAKIIANKTKAQFIEINATSGSTKELKEHLRKAENSLLKTIIFIDEIHRFNKAQQDVLLPYVERGDIVLIGATTENPSFTVISPLISRSKILVFERLDNKSLLKILNRALKNLDGVSSTKKAKELIVNQANGDARTLLNLVEDLSKQSKKIDKKDIENSQIVKTLKYDKDGEEHYNIISALHKSMRDSDPDGAVYWLMRMLEAGEDPLYVARRLIRFASEDIGMSDPHALLVATACYDACRFIGMPECDVIMVQTVIHLSVAPKSNSCYKAVLSTRTDIRKYGNLDVPKHIRNASTKLMNEMGYGKGYKYAHDYEDAQVKQEHLPKELKDKVYYSPSDRGLEKKIKKQNPPTHSD